MGNLDFFIRDMALITVACTLITLIFRKLKLPVILGYILAGFLISPNFVYLPTIVEVSNINDWANIGIVFLMFALGLEFSFKKVAGAGVSAIVTAMTVMTAMIILGTVTGSALGFARMDSIFLGCMISISSTMVIMKAYEEYKLKKEGFASLVISTMVIEDICGIFVMVVLSTIAVGKSVSGIEMTFELGKLLLFLMIWLVLGIYLIPTLLRKTDKLMNDELLLLASVAICFGMVVISYLIGFSEALGAFMGGSILGGTVKGEHIDRLVRPLKDLFGAVFFVSVGMMVEPDILVKYVVPIIIITAVTILGQMIFATLGILFSGRTLKTAVRGGFSMVQIGEFSFIIAAMGNSLGVISDFLYPVIVCVSVITICTTPVFIKNSDRAYVIISRMLPKNLKRFLRQYTSESNNTKERDDDWKRFWGRYFTRTFICGALMFTVYFFSTGFLADLVRPYLPGIADNLILTILTCAILFVPASIMIHRKNNLFIKLWIKSKTNRLPLTLLRAGQIVIAAMFFILVIRHYFRLPWWLLLIIALVIIFVIARIDFFKSSAIKIEARFVANINEKVLQRRKDESKTAGWMRDRLYVSEFVVFDPYDMQTVAEVYDNRLFDMRVIKLVRGDTHYNIPKGDIPVKKGDVIQLIGTRDELDAYLLLLERDENIKTPDRPLVPMKEYLYGQVFDGIPPEDQIIYVAVPVEKNSPFIRKTVKNSGFREKYNGFIVGIERHNYPMVDPDINTVIHEKDVLWVVGTEETAELLIKDDLITEG